MDKFTLGEQVRDIVSGFTGIAIARIETLEGNTYYQVAQQGAFSGPVEATINECRLKKEGKGVFHEVQAEIKITRSLGEATPRTEDEPVDEIAVDEGNIPEDQEVLEDTEA